MRRLVCTCPPGGICTIRLLHNMHDKTPTRGRIQFLRKPQTRTPSSPLCPKPWDKKSQQKASQHPRLPPLPSPAPTQPNPGGKLGKQELSSPLPQTLPWRKTNKTTPFHPHQVPGENSQTQRWGETHKRRPALVLQPAPTSGRRAVRPETGLPAGERTASE